MSRLTVIVVVLLLVGCAANPRELCAQYVPDNWDYVGEDAELEELLGPLLPKAPYKTNEGNLVMSVRHIWYSGGATRLFACSLSRHARDECSARMTDFVLIDGRWSKRSEDEVLCNVLAVR